MNNIILNGFSFNCLNITKYFHISQSLIEQYINFFPLRNYVGVMVIFTCKSYME